MFGLGVFCPRLIFAFCQGVGPSYSGSKKTLRCAHWNTNWIWKRTVSLKLWSLVSINRRRRARWNSSGNWKRTISLNFCACIVESLVSINTTQLLLVLWSSHNKTDPRSNRTKHCISSSGYPFFLSTTMQRCLQFSSMPHPLCLQWTKPTRYHPAINHQKLHGNCNPTRNKRTHPFVLRSSSHSLRVGRRCHQTLYSWVLFCLPFHTLLPNWCVVMVILFSIGVWSYTLWFCLWLFVCGFCVFHDISIYVSLFWVWS